MKRYIFIPVLFLILCGGLFAQSLENNEYYQKSVEFANLSQESLDNGEYEEAAEYAVESQRYAALSRQYIEEMLMAFRANSAYAAAKARMEQADRINLKTENGELYDEASGAFALATEKMGSSDYENSIADSRRVLELLADMEQWIPKSNFAAFYVVKLNPVLRDCLWRIAGFDFIYGDSHQWRRLYEANKDTFPDPENPNLIEPGQILKIPSIRGEYRDGTR